MKKLMRRRKFRMKRIYIGPPGAELTKYWTVAVTDAKEPVTIKGTVWHALTSYAGSTIACSLSNAAIDVANRKAFGHPVLYVVFLRTVCLVITKLDKSGTPSHAIRYTHTYSDLVEKNDRGLIKSLVKQYPSIMEREFTLHAPRIGRPRGDTTNAGSSGQVKTTRAFVPHGALARAVDAGLISPAMAKHMRDAAKAA